MKNFKLIICEAFMERLVTLAALEEKAQFRGVYLDALSDAADARARLRRSTSAPQKASAPAHCIAGGCVRNA